MTCESEAARDSLSGSPTEHWQSNTPMGTWIVTSSAEPVALLLVAYGRRSQWGPVLTGKLVAWGRKPWAGLRLTRYLVTP